MSSVGKAVGVVRSILNHQEELKRVDEKLKGLSKDLARLAGSHAHLRDRVSQIEGFLKAATGQPFSGPMTPKIEG